MRRLQTLDEFVERAARLYTLPAVAVEVLELTSLPETDTEALRRCIENDPAITAKILRVVNSSLFGLSREVSDLKQAIALLGIKPLKLLVLGFSLADELFSGVTGKLADRYWQHSLCEAAAARTLSERLWQMPGDEPFLAGLLDGVGMLVLMQELGLPYAEVIDRVLAAGRSPEIAERQMLGFDHRQLSAALLAKWRIPESIVRCVVQSDDLPGTTAGLSGPRIVMPGILKLARLMADLLVDGRHEVLPELVRLGASEHQLSDHRLMELVCDVQRQVTELGSAFAIGLPAGLDYRDVLVRAHAQLAELAEGLAGEIVHKDFQPEDDAEFEAWSEVQGLSGALADFLKADPARQAPIARNVPARSLPEERFTHASHKQPAGPVAVSHAGAAAASGEGELLARLNVAVSACRQTRSSLSLAIVEIDRFQGLVALLGPIAAEQFVARFATLVRKLRSAENTVLQIGEARFAIVLPACERSAAILLLEPIVRGMPAWQTGERPQLSASAGVASLDMPSKNFPPDQLLASANLCLEAAQLSGGNTIKSISV